MDSGYHNRLYQVPKQRVWSYMNRPRYERRPVHRNRNSYQRNNIKTWQIVAVVALIIVIIAAIALAVYFGINAKNVPAYENAATLKTTFYLPDAAYDNDYAIQTSDAFRTFTNEFCNTITVGFENRLERLKDCIVNSLRDGSVYVNGDLIFIENSIGNFDDTDGVLNVAIQALMGQDYGDVTGEAQWNQDTLDEDNRDADVSAKTTTEETLPSGTTSPYVTTVSEPIFTTQDATLESKPLSTNAIFHTSETTDGITDSQTTSVNDHTALHETTISRDDIFSTTDYPGGTETTMRKISTIIPILTTTGIKEMLTMKTTESMTTEPASTEETTTQQPLSVWTDWSDWGNCDVSCGSGIKQRSRSCEQDNCAGSDKQSDSCVKALCPRAANSYNVWSSWAAWTTCGATCGNSTQRRERTCGQDSQKFDCIGKDFQERVCNVGVCPDCSGYCSGSWDVECLRCECTGNDVSGRVTTTHGGPLDNVVVTSVDKSYLNLTVTGTNGGFTISNICNGQELLFTRAGYQSQTTTYNSQNTIRITMGKIVPLTIIKQSNNIGRLAGNCLELQCEVIGYPEPDNYEWFKDGLLLQDLMSSTVTIQSVILNDTGLYRCRANNDYGAALSDEIKVIVEEHVEDFCTTVPKPLIKQLPDGCLFDGSTEVELGTCNSGLCSKGGEQTCSDSMKYTCGGVTRELIYANCSTYQLPLQLIKECGCIEKEETYLELVGQVRDSRHDDPIEGVTVSSGTLTMNTSESGEFVFSLTPGLNKLTLDLNDPFQRYVQQITVVRFGQNFEGSFDYAIKMNPKASPVIVSAEEEIVVELGSENVNSPGFADIIIPANSMYDSNGDHYNGTVQVNVDVFDPRENQTEANPPGDFTATNEEGEESNLISTGMMRLSVEDENGNSINMGGELEISVDESMFSEAEETDNLKLWALNKETGKWVYVADLDTPPQRRRRKRYVYSARVRGIDIDSEWFNFDIVANQICHTKIRVFQAKSINEQLPNIDVKIITLPSKSSPGTTLSRVRSTTDDTTDTNGYCIVHSCNSPRSTAPYDYHGYILADYKGSQLSPAKDMFDDTMNYTIENNKIHVNFNYFAGPNGPFYDWDYYWSSSTQCSNAPVTDLHFKFYKDDASKCDDYEYTILPRTVFPVPDEENVYLWNVPGLTAKYASCFIKLLTTWDSQSTVQATSSIGFVDSVELPSGDVFGVRRKCTENKASCVEVRSPYGITDGVVTYAGHTRVTIKLTDSNPRSYVGNKNLLEMGDVTRTDDASLVYIVLRNMSYGSEYGVYCSESSLSRLQAKRSAEHLCRRGSNNQTESGLTQATMSQDGWAVKFHDYFVTVLPENGGCPGGSTPLRACWGSVDVDENVEFCTKEGYVCKRCPITSAIPTFPNDNHTCDESEKHLTFHGCCPKFPRCLNGRNPQRMCTNESIIQKPFEYCTDEGVLCDTCESSWVMPEKINSNGNCSNPNHHITRLGCCPIIPTCPGGYKAFGNCNYTIPELEIYGNFFYCLDGYMCYACAIVFLFQEALYFNVTEVPLIIPETITDSGECNNSQYIVSEYEFGCCPACPGGIEAHGSCLNTSDIYWSNLYYCTDNGLACPCPYHNTIPDGISLGEKCNNDSSLEWWEGCCSPYPKCPNGEYPSYENSHCQNDTDCDYRRFCTNEGVCCDLCYGSDIVPERVNDDGTCSRISHLVTPVGCCPICPNTYYYSHWAYACTNNTQCSTGYSCTNDGICCQECHGTEVLPEYPTENQTCARTGYGFMYEGCCPVCPGHNRWAYQNKCDNNTDCSVSEFCAPGGVCCSISPYSDVIPEFLNENGSCSKHELGFEFTSYGCVPGCPGGYFRYGVCQNDSDCSIAEYCNVAGICCDRCPGSNMIPKSLSHSYNVRSYAFQSSCADVSRYVTEKGCCPVCYQAPGGNCTECGPRYYCTSEKTCCKKCIDSNVLPRPSLANDTCEDPEYEYTGLGCCPVCFNGKRSSVFCRNDTDCGPEYYCTAEGMCCDKCPISYVEPGQMMNNNTCVDHGYQVGTYGCCPVCFNGWRSSGFCLNDTDCGPEYYCTAEGMCCDKCPISNTEPGQMINSNTCVDPGYQVGTYGCCPELTKCPYSDSPSQSCVSTDECNYWQQTCTDEGVCCNRCPDNNYYWYAGTPCLSYVDCNYGGLCGVLGFCCYEPYDRLFG